MPTQDQPSWDCGPQSHAQAQVRKLYNHVFGWIGKETFVWKGGGFMTRDEMNGYIPPCKEPNFDGSVLCNDCEDPQSDCPFYLAREFHHYPWWYKPLYLLVITVIGGLVGSAVFAILSMAGAS